MGYNYIPKYIRQSETKRPKDVITAARWNELFNLLIEQGDYTAEELGKILGYLSTGLEDLASAAAAAITEEHEYASAFEIRLYTNTDPVTADKSFAEIRQAIVDGREIILWVSDVQCLKPACKVFENGLMLTVFDNSVHGQALRADLYECSNEDHWIVEQHIKLVGQDDYNAHITNGTIHVTAADRTAWNGKLSDAPSDGKQYARKNGAWAEVQSSGGSGSMCVNVTASGGVYSADKTRAQIVAAINAGTFVYMMYSGTHYYLDMVNDAYVSFERNTVSEDRVISSCCRIFDYTIDWLHDEYSSVLYVEVVKDGDNYISDKSYEDIRVAVKLRNQAAVVVYDEGFYPLTEISEDGDIALFSNSMVNIWADVIMQNMFIITPDGVQVLENTWELNTGGGAFVIDYSHPQSTDYNNAIAAFTAGNPVLLKKNNAQIPMTGYNPDHCYFGGTLSAYLPGGYVIAVYAHIGPNGENYFWYEYQSAIDGAQKPLVVTITQSGGLSNYTADKTNAEIYAAWQAGQEVVLLLNGGKLPCLQADATSAYFNLLIGGDGISYGLVSISTTGESQTVTVSMTALQSTTITDSAGYFTTDTVEGALAEIGAELSGINTLIGSGEIV